MSKPVTIPPVTPTNQPAKKTSWYDAYKSKWGSSSFWLGDDTRWSGSSYLNNHQASTMDVIKLASAKRSIGNFVNIVTKKQIPVDFIEEGSTSMTDGKRVLISSSVKNPEDFDITVGLALHEGSHIKLSDYDILHNLNSRISRALGNDFTRYMDKCNNVGCDMTSLIKDLLNWVEDRRVDQYIYDEAPGYQGYYHAMYDKYFNSEFIETALKSKSFRDETIQSYTIRLVNLHSEYSDLTALKGLQKIWDLVDLKNINRLKTTDMSFDVAIKIFRIIMDLVHSNKSQMNNDENPKPQNSKGQQGQKGQGSNQSQKTKPKPQDSKEDQEGEEGGDDNEQQDDTKDEDKKGKGKGKSGGDTEDQDENESDGDSTEGGNEDDPNEKSKSKSKSNKSNSESEDDNEGEGDDTKEDGTQSKGNKSKSNKSEEDESDEDESESDRSDNSGGNESGSGSQSEDGEVDTEPIELTQREFEAAIKKLAEQSKFLAGDVKKETLSSTEMQTLINIVQSNTGYVPVGEEFGNGEINCIVAKTLNEALLVDNSFPMKASYNSSSYKDFVDEGIKLGTVLGKKLLIRSESRETVFNRQTTGKIDKRMISALGYGYDNVFFTKEVDKFKKANLHISVDASGSMGGHKWKKTLINVVALIKAIDMIPNLEVQVSFRTTTQDDKNPYIVIAYDSRVDKFIKVKQLFHKIGPTNTTPEGLCFEAIMKLLVPANQEVDSYFLNISDGEPYFSTYGKTYSGYSAAKHTNRMVKKIEDMGIKVLSYFISAGSTSGSSHDNFRTSYGKAASFIDVNSVAEISKTMNQLFMTK